MLNLLETFVPFKCWITKQDWTDAYKPLGCWCCLKLFFKIVGFQNWTSKMLTSILGVEVAWNFCSRLLDQQTGLVRCLQASWVLKLLETFFPDYWITKQDWSDAYKQEIVRLWNMTSQASGMLKLLETFLPDCWIMKQDWSDAYKHLRCRSCFKLFFPDCWITKQDWSDAYKPLGCRSCLKLLLQIDGS